MDLSDLIFKASSLQGGSESQVVLAGPSGTGERRKAGRLRKKLVGRGTTRFDEVSTKDNITA